MAAKPKTETAADGSDIHEIAKSLFVQSYRPRGNIDAWMIAIECFRAAEQFTLIASKVASGMTADDVIAERQLQDEQKTEDQPAEAVTEPSP